MKNGCWVYRQGQQPKQVKNLAWLLRNWKDVKSFAVEKRLLDDNSGIVTALTAFGDDWYYQTEYASLSVLHGFLNRPIFVGLPVNWLSPDVVKIGSLEYAKLTPNIAD